MTVVAPQPRVLRSGEGLSDIREAGGLAAPFIGRLFDRSGPRTVYTLGLALLGGAFLCAAYAQQLWQFQLTLGLCAGLGIACIGNVPNSILLGRWFGPRLPTAMAVVYSAMGGGVLALARGLDRTLYAGGNFLNAGGNANADYIGSWNGAAWTALPSGSVALNGQVNALAVVPSGLLYAGGTFTNASGIAAADYIASWNGAAWAALGTGWAWTPSAPSAASRCRHRPCRTCRCPAGASRRAPCSTRGRWSSMSQEPPS